MVLNLRLRRLLVGGTPLAGAIAFPILVPLLMVRVGLAAGLLAAVVIGSLWFVSMLVSAEMPHEG
jgi:hypothetical protein